LLFQSNGGFLPPGFTLSFTFAGSSAAVPALSVLGSGDLLQAGAKSKQNEKVKKAMNAFLMAAS
jgi:hypothetical protein